MADHRCVTFMNETGVRDIYTEAISTNVILLGVVSFLNDFSSEMIIPILPMFIKTLGGTGLVIGLVGGFRDSISSILKVLCGYLSDITGRRKIFVYSGYLTSSLFKLSLGLSKTCGYAAVFASAERIGKGLRTAARDAIIAESMATQRGKGFGIHRALDTSGAICGSIAVFLLFWFFNLGFNLIIFSASIIGFLSLIPLHFVKEHKRQPREAALGTGPKSLPASLKLFILISIVFALGNFSYMFFVIRAQQFFASRLSVAGPILLYTLFNIFYAGFAVPLGAISDRIGRAKVIVFGYLLFALTSAGFAFISSLPAFIALFALYGVSRAALEANQRAYVADLSPDNTRATVLGTFHTGVGLAALPANLVAGFLWQSIAPEMVFIYGSMLSFVSIVLFIAFSGHFGLPRGSK